VVDSGETKPRDPADVSDSRLSELFEHLRTKSGSQTDATSVRPADSDGVDPEIEDRLETLGYK
jgi:hypothetical protein